MNLDRMRAESRTRTDRQRAFTGMSRSALAIRGEIEPEQQRLVDAFLRRMFREGGWVASARARGIEITPRVR